SRDMLLHVMKELDQSQTGSGVNRKLSERRVGIRRETHPTAQCSKRRHRAGWQLSRVQPRQRLVEEAQCPSSGKGLSQILAIWMGTLHEWQEYGKEAAVTSGQPIDAVA